MIRTHPLLATTLCSLLWLATASARAQTEPTPLDEGRARLAVHAYQSAIVPLEDAEEAGTGDTRVEARLLLARAYRGLHERDEQRFYLEQVVADREATPLQIERAEAGLEAMLPPRPAQYYNPLSDDPLLVTALVFAGLEVVLLIAGGVVVAETGCVHDPMPCSSTGRSVGFGLLVAGSVWWIVPAVLSVLFGLGVGAVRSGSAGWESRSSLRESGVIRF